MPPEQQTVEIPIQGMDCADCTRHVQSAIVALPGVQAVEVFLASEKAVVQLDPARVGLETIRQAVARAGYQVAAQPSANSVAAALSLQQRGGAFTRQVLTLLGLVFGAILFIIVIGEWLGLFEALTARLPWPLGLVLVALAGYPVFANVIRAALRRQVIAHTLMTIGVLAALLVGEWATAVVVVFFMRVGDYAEHFTAERARRAVRDLVSLAPQKARLERAGQEIEVPADQVQLGEVVIIRPGEVIPVDGEVIAGQATIDQSTITGESMPLDAGPGSRVFASTLAHLGGLRVRADQVGRDTTFGRVIRMVEEAEAQRADVQRLADRFSAYYLPVVSAIALLTYLLRRDPLATAAVLVVACSCAFALATPIAMLASIGAAARRGLMIKGGKYLELLARADVLLIDKTGTLTLGRPILTDVIPAAGFTETGLLRLAASAERYSEHPLAAALRTAARQRGLSLFEPEQFTAQPGLGVSALVDGQSVQVGSQRLLEAVPAGHPLLEAAAVLQAQGKALLVVVLAGQVVGLLAAADTLRDEVPAALRRLPALGIRQVELLTGDHAAAAAALVQQLGGEAVLRYRAGLLPEDKIQVVRQYQAQGHTVIMIGDGVNDAPALAQADIGVAMGQAGSAVAVEAAHVALLREDWSLVPELLSIAHRTLRVIKGNLAFTVAYNLVGLALAALGILPPILAAAAQSLPDLGILANSSRLLRQ